MQAKSGASESGRFRKIDAEAVSAALVAAGHLGGGMAEVLLHVAGRGNFTGLMSTLTRSLPLQRESGIDEKALRRMIKVTGGITSGIFSIMSQLAIAAIENGEERILSRDATS